MRAWIAAAIMVASVGDATAADDAPLVDADWVADRLDASAIVLLDIRGASERGANAVFEAGHIPGSVSSSYATDGWRVDREGVPGMLPSAEALATLVGGLGIANDDHVVIVYGGLTASDFGSAARVYWTLQQVGHEAISILDGGFAAWTADPSRPVADGANPVTPVAYEVRPALGETLATVSDVERALDGSALLVDARPAPQFDGLAQHPVARVAGHIPGATNVSQATWFAPDTGKLGDVDAIADTLPATVVDGDEPLISYCNTGHWAATNWFVLSEVLGRKDVSLYDGSMTEWTADPARPVSAPVN